MTKLLSLQACRGIAALVVVFYHVTLFMREHAGDGIFGPVTVYGVLGVNFFFVLSGFIILMAHSKDMGKPVRAWPYVRRRFLRIYPLYWIVLLAYVAGAAFGLGHGFSFSAAPDQLLSPAMLVYSVPLVSPDPLPVKVGWTLFYEVQFYLLFAILVVDKRAGMAVFIAWFAAILFLRYTGGVTQQSPLFTAHTTFFSAWNLHFLFGMLAYLVSCRVPDRFWSFFLGSGALMVSFFVFRYARAPEGVSIHMAQNDLLPFLAIAFAALVAGLVMAERAGCFKAPAILCFAGDASYSLYLVHSAVLSVGLPLLVKSGVAGFVGPAITFVLLCFLAIAGGCACYLLIERPLLEALLRRKKTPDVTAVCE